MLNRKARTHLVVFLQVPVTYFFSVNLKGGLKEVCSTSGSSAHPFPFKAIVTLMACAV